jgi:hypothetical protein
MLKHGLGLASNYDFYIKELLLEFGIFLFPSPYVGVWDFPFGIAFLLSSSVWIWNFSLWNFLLSSSFGIWNFPFGISPPYILSASKANNTIGK